MVRASSWNTGIEGGLLIERVVIVVVEDKDKVQNVKQVLLGTAPSADHKQ